MRNFYIIDFYFFSVRLRQDPSNSTSTLTCVFSYLSEVVKAHGCKNRTHDNLHMHGGYRILLLFRIM